MLVRSFSYMYICMYRFLSYIGRLITQQTLIDQSGQEIMLSLKSLIASASWLHLCSLYWMIGRYVFCTQLYVKMDGTLNIYEFPIKNNKCCYTYMHFHFPYTMRSCYVFVFTKKILSDGHECIWASVHLRKYIPFEM